MATTFTHAVVVKKVNRSVKATETIKFKATEYTQFLAYAEEMKLKGKLIARLVVSEGNDQKWVELN